MSTVKTIYAGSVAKLDSNVFTGGGTDDTAALQAVLDTAKDNGGVHLIMDGAALVSGLVVYSGTTIEALNKNCGFFQKAGSNRSIVTNADWQRDERNVRNISLIGGTYNQDCTNQLHHVDATPEMKGANCFEGIHGVCALEFCGVENLLVRDIDILDFRTYAFMLTNFKRATIEDVWLDLPHRMQAQNQDGLHFWGPGQFLTIRNVGGKVGDDFMNIGPDEGDLKSDITDVIVDGVFLDDADQAIRILSRGTGLVDRCTIRNVHGSYRSFGFYINSWFPDVTAGNFGDIFIENVNLTHTEPNYDYRPPMLFSVGGDIRCLTLKNIRHEYPTDNRVIGEFGLPFYATTPFTVADYEYPGQVDHVIKNLIIDGVTVIENSDSENMDKFAVYGHIGNMIVKNVLSVKDEGVSRSGDIIKIEKPGSVDTLIVNNVFSVGNNNVISGKEAVSELLQSEIIEK